MFETQFLLNFVDALLNAYCLVQNQSANDFIKIFLRCFFIKFNVFYLLGGGDTEFFSMLSLPIEWLS